MKLIVGLGNPGSQYAGTRHNVGFDVLDRMAWRWNWTPAPDEFDRLARSNFQGLTLDGTAPGGEKVLLLKPQTFMNLCGPSVQSAAGFYQLTPADLLIVLDDVALPCGRIRLRAGGSSGGHNGLKDIERCLGGSQYPRLRLGIDAPPARVPQRDWVLSRFSPVQRPLMEQAVDRAACACETWIERGIAVAMSQFNAPADEIDEKQ